MILQSSYWQHGQEGWRNPPLAKDILARNWSCCWESSGWLCFALAENEDPNSSLLLLLPPTSEFDWVAEIALGSHGKGVVDVAGLSIWIDLVTSRLCWRRWIRQWIAIMVRNPTQEYHGVNDGVGGIDVNHQWSLLLLPEAKQSNSDDFSCSIVALIYEYCT